MMRLLKSAVFVAAMTVIMSGLAPLKSSAGIYIVKRHYGEHEAANGLFVAAIGAVGLMATVATLVDNKPVSIWIPIASLGLLVLDAKGEITTQELHNQIATRYPFLDNDDAVERATLELQRRYAQMDHSNPITKVNLDEPTAREIFSDADLTEEQMELLVRDFTS